MRLPRRAHASELAVLIVAAAGLAAALPLDAGYFGWSWDALNHHIYLGYMAERPRLGQDVLAASFQSYQYPYLYWPIYRLSLLEGNGAYIGAGWAAAQAALLLPPIWLLSLRLLGDAQAPWTLSGAAERAAACALAFLSVVVLVGFETTANDLLAAVPLTWAFAVMAATPSTNRRATVAAALWGVSAAFKFSNAIFLPLLLLWWLLTDTRGSGTGPWRRGVMMAAGAGLGFGLAYLPWGWQLWLATGNPFYPYLQSAFAATVQGT
jgi:hypothetical protein